MTNEVAIKILQKLYEGCNKHKNTDLIKEAYNMAIEALKAQIDKDTNVPNTDSISRRAALDALHGYFDEMLETDTWSPCDVYGLIEILPSAQSQMVCVANVTLTDEQVQEAFEKAKRGILSVQPKQPEIIRCKDCEYGEQDEVGRWFCRSLGCQIGNEDGSGYCADAERRTNG